MTDPKTVSRNCADGNHARCLGTVYIYPPDGEGRRIVACTCPVKNCGHGSETEKAKRKG